MANMRLRNDFDLLPEYPRTPHLPINPNPDEGDIVADQQAVEDMFDASTVFVEEKIDGANVGVSYHKGNFVVRNRRHFLKKGYLHKNPSGQQFRPLWNWLYESQGNFQLLHRLLDFEEDEPVSVYGEWCWMAHGIHYTALPAFFIAFDIYDPAKGKFFEDRTKVRRCLEQAGFAVSPLLFVGKFHRFADGEINLHPIRNLMDNASRYTEVKPVMQEGIYIRFRHYHTGEPKRYKMVRPDFQRGLFFKDNEIVRNLLVKK